MKKTVKNQSAKLSFCLQLVCLILSVTCSFYVQNVFASSASSLPLVRTNINEVTSEFDTYIPDKRELDIHTDELRNAGAKSAESPNVGDFLSVEDAGKLSSEQGRLSSIDENSLESEGRRERNKEENAYFTDFETDYTKPGAMAHKMDADEIVDATDKKMGELTELLRINGIDCKGVAKAAEIKDPYTIEVERREGKEVEYDQKFCEYLKNTYSCSDTLTMTCIKTAWKYDAWQSEVKYMVFPGGDARSYGWLYGVYWKKKTFGLHMHIGGGMNTSVQRVIASKLKVNEGQIGSIGINPRGEGPIHHAGGKEYIFDTYTVSYKYRTGELICETWSEGRWDEVCSLTSR